jgi:hypothetical protein
MTGQNVEIAHCPSNVSNDVSEHTRLDYHAKDHNNSFVRVDWMKIAVAHCAGRGDDPVQGVDVLLHDTGILEVLNLKPTAHSIIVLSDRVPEAGDPVCDEDYYH